MRSKKHLCFWSSFSPLALSTCRECTSYTWYSREDRRASHPLTYVAMLWLLWFCPVRPNCSVSLAAQLKPELGAKLCGKLGNISPDLGVMEYVSVWQCPFFTTLCETWSCRDPFQGHASAMTELQQPLSLPPSSPALVHNNYKIFVLCIAYT